jgi:predicted YcjX-like family ATPase
MRSLLDETRIALGGVKDFARSFATPNLRLGVTGLSRSGKTVFITALVHALLHGGRLPLFSTHAAGRIVRAYLEPQPDDDLPRFAYEDHLAALTGEDRRWPESTRRLSQLRLTVEYMGSGLFSRDGVARQLAIDIIDYPGEWLLDLPLMNLSYEEWSAATLAASRRPPRLQLAASWHEHLASLEPEARRDEQEARRAAELFTSYLEHCRADGVSLSTLPPGRFLMPGDLAGSPLLTFAPLDLHADRSAPRGSLWALMARRYDSYVANVVKPFFLDHFARLDRQIVLVDVLSALNAGAEAVLDLRLALTGVLDCFRLGSKSWASVVLGRRIDRILFAATKADLLHHDSHRQLERIFRAIVSDAVSRAEFSGARIDVTPLAAIRATREATVRRRGDALPCIAGVPEAGESIGHEAFDGRTEAAIFPGDLPDSPEAAINGALEGKVRFARFRPPLVEAAGSLVPAGGFPHMHLDRVMEFLFGDRLR